jgi:hypothetical protein
MVDLVGIYVPHPVFADPLHDPPVATPVLRHVAHVVIGGVVNGTGAAGALLLGMDASETFAAFELPHHIGREVVWFVVVADRVEGEVGRLLVHVLELKDKPGDLHGRSSNSGWEDRFTMSVLTWKAA